MKHTGGKWNPNEDVIYFLPADVGSLVVTRHIATHTLVAINEIHNEKDMTGVRQLFAAGQSVLIDSGVFMLATTHAKRHKLTMDEALSTAPDQVDGFDKLFEQYVAVVTEFKESAWGYIEIDQGGRDNKIKTRARLEAMGFAPIPVYHPFNDGWDYFDELAQNYDRICFGNVVQADPATRKRLCATAWERRRKYPNLWIHMLGLTPGETLNAYPINSCDSSTWLGMVRWPDAHKTRVACQPFAGLHQNYAYDLKAEREADTGHKKSRRFCAYEAVMTRRNWRAALGDYRDRAGCDTLSPC